ncbi:MAG: tRNA (mnm(5)s(2)U34)-methyltransferase [Oscillospiraceae bacterium]
MFNFGWLPGGDHSIFTRAETSIAAIQQGMQLLGPDGVMSLCIYYGRDTGFAEKDALLEYVRNLDSRACTVIVHEFANRPNCPPIFVSIQKGL